MDIIISNANNSPIYEQIYRQIKNSILSGSLQEGDMLPSIRALAKDLRISVITTKRAYDELEKDGYIHTVAGKGCFVAEKNTELIREENLRQIEEHLRAAIALAPSCDLSRGDVGELLELLWDKD
ncbi:MAG: GntR family transcriptional regulator [Firmicutes bacterium]|nr:GntR family transcriptional regulator [Bacillota bacterium]